MVPNRIKLLALALLLLPSLALSAETLNIDGLRQPVEIIKDKWGISHIYAKNQHDLFFAQGWNAARDRLFQFEIWRRHATGTLAEIQGEKAFVHDRGARLLRYRGNLAEEMVYYHKDGIDIVTAFVEGVNAYIERTRQHPELLPFEFKLLGIEPGFFTPAVILSRHNALTGGIATEIKLAQLITAVGPKMTERVLDFYRKPYLVPKQGIDLSALDMSLMDEYLASRRLPPFAASDLKVPASASALKSLNRIASAALDNPFDPSLGSNNWVVSGNRTRSGKPIMANDPHRHIEDPSLRYMVHLNAPGWNVIGAGEPVLPGVSIGHNDYGAWGLTVFHIDQEDLYVYRTNPANPNQYWYRGAWKDMEIENDTLHVRGEGDKPIALKYTIHGPVLKEDPAHHVAYAMRAVWLMKGAAPYLASLRMDQATNFAEFRAACAHSGLPGENMVWADRNGNIGWQAVGFTPIRIGWAGRLPVPGDG
ncbi:MAG TPA: penicillin acylase family protein, partial [Pseudomonadales bacterium]|nr:penicillin acylase family protein [Pseudomonadales bacterium]